MQEKLNHLYLCNVLENAKKLKFYCIYLEFILTVFIYKKKLTFFFNSSLRVYI